MAKTSIYYFLIDSLNVEKAEKLRKALLATDNVEEAAVKLNSGLLEVYAKRDPETEVRMAASISGCGFRMKINKKKASYYA